MGKSSFSADEFIQLRPKINIESQNEKSNVSLTLFGPGRAKFPSMRVLLNISKTCLANLRQTL